MVSIYWKDLTTEKQKEILQEFGDNCNFDVVPIVELERDDEDDDFEDEEDFEDEDDE